MNKFCSHCGYANAGNALRCENCKLFVGVSPEDKDIRSFSGIRLIGILVVVGFLSLAIYKMLDNSSAKPKTEQGFSLPKNIHEMQRKADEEERQRLKRVIPR